MFILSYFYNNYNLYALKHGMFITKFLLTVIVPVLTERNN